MIQKLSLSVHPQCVVSFTSAMRQRRYIYAKSTQINFAI